MDYVSKDEFLFAKVRGKRVLHLGCVGFAGLETATRIAMAESSLHFALSKVADVTGVDYSREAIDFFSTHGVFDNVRFGNAERLEELDLQETFDVIVAGDIIEHLSNPGLMLDGLRRFCRDDTAVIITTPHAFGLPNFVRHARGRFQEGSEHVMTFNAQTLEHLLQRHGYRIVHMHTCHQKRAENRRLFKVGRLFFRTWPRLGGTLLVEAELTSRHPSNRNDVPAPLGAGVIPSQG